MSTSVRRAQSFSRQRCGWLSRGFSLMEMMVAIAVLAIALVAIMSAQQAALNGSILVQRGQAAALGMRTIVLGIEEEYRKEGFPENSITDRDCEVPEEYEEWFECTYDLERLELEAAQMQELVDQSFGGLLSQGGLENLMAGGTDSATIGTQLQGMLQSGGEGNGLNVGGLAFLAPFLGPEGQALMSLCNVNLSMLFMGFMGVQAFIPTVLQNVSNRTRKLTVTLTWSEGPFGTREYAITTFITSRPEEELQMLREQQEAKEVMGLTGEEGLGGSGTGTGSGRGTGEGGGGGR